MKSLWTALLSSSLLFSVSTGFADEHEEDNNVAAPVEMFACSYNEGKGPKDLDAAIKKFNSWGDKNGVDNYSAWTLVPFYAGPSQEFDLLWLGGSPKAKALGALQDSWLASGGDGQAAFDKVMTCDMHSAFAALQMKAPPKRENPSNVVISFSDCNPVGDTTFDDLYTPIMEWGKYRASHGSTAGMWVFFPAFGGGGEKFAFKWVTAYQNLEELGADWDQYSEKGWQKVNELFTGKLQCDSSRSYLATNHRMAKSASE